MSKKSECKYCKFINEDMPLEKDRGREVTEIRYSTKDNNAFYWGHRYRVPLNFCPNCGAKMAEIQESEGQGMKSRITGRIEEWWKSVCRGRNCKYYLHKDYPSCSYCTCPDNNCIVVKEYEAERNNEK